MKTKTEKELEREILQDLYDKGMIDFEGDENRLTMQVPTNIIETGQFVVDVYKEGMKKAKEEFNKKVGDSYNLLIEINERLHSNYGFERDKEGVELFCIPKEHYEKWIKSFIDEKLKEINKIFNSEKEEKAK